MANEGFIKLYRKMLKWGWYDEPNTKAVFLHLLFLAQYEESFYRGVHLEIGQAVATYDEIALANGLSKKQVRTAVEHLIETGEVALKRYPKFCVYTLKNYEQYNGDGTQTAHKGHAEGTQRALKGHSHMLRSQEVEEGKNIDIVGVSDETPPKRTGFTPPTLDELEEYACQIGYALDARHFLDYYTANGWMVGKHKMKDWKAAVRTWQRRDKSSRPAGETVHDQLARVLMQEGEL